MFLLGRLKGLCEDALCPSCHQATHGEMDALPNTPKRIDAYYINSLKGDGAFSGTLRLEGKERVCGASGLSQGVSRPEEVVDAS